MTIVTALAPCFLYRVAGARSYAGGVLWYSGREVKYAFHRTRSADWFAEQRIGVDADRTVQSSMDVGLVLLIVENATLGRPPSYREVRELALAAEQTGFDSLWLYDHLLYRPPGEGDIGIWECWTMLSALADATSRVEIGSLVACSSFRNPALLAKMAATLDEVSGGRLVLGMGAGWNEAEFRAFGYPFDHRVDRFEEAVQIVRPLLREGRVNFEGKYYQAKECVLRPRGPRPDGPPLLLGAFGDRMLHLTARYADRWNGGYAIHPDNLTDVRQALVLACEEEGRDPGSLATSAMPKVAFPDLQEPPAFMQGEFLSDVEEIARALQAFADAGYSEVMIHCSPSTPETVTRLTVALDLFRAQ